MKIITKIGIAISVAALFLFLSCFFGGKYTLVFSFTKDFRNIVSNINEQNRAARKWDAIIYTDYTFTVTKNSNHGWVRDHNVMLLILILLCTITGSLLYIIPKY